MHKTFFKENKRVRRYEKSFSEETRGLFIDNYECWECGMNNWDCLHHIKGGEFEEADSPLNAAPLHNFKCHMGDGHHFSEEQISLYLAKTLRYLLLRVPYSFTDKDREFISKNLSLYCITVEGIDAYKLFEKKYG